MKTLSLSTLAIALLTSLSAQAQTPVSTGIVQGVGKEDGTLMLRTDQPNAAPLTFYGMDKAKIETVTGKVGTLADISAGMSVTVHYAQQANRWYVSRVLIPDPAMAGTTATGHHRRQRDRSSGRQRERGYRCRRCFDQYPIHSGH
jgi:hypothetical protein